MEPPAARAEARRAAAGARAVIGRAPRPLAASAHKPKAKPPKVRGDPPTRRATAAQQHLEKFQRPFTAAQLWENTQRVVAKKEIVAALSRRSGGPHRRQGAQSGKPSSCTTPSARRHGAQARRLRDARGPVRRLPGRSPCVEIKILRRVHGDATPARWRGRLDGASAATSSPRKKNHRVHPTHWLISAQLPEDDRRRGADRRPGREARKARPASARGADERRTRRAPARGRGGVFPRTPGRRRDAFAAPRLVLSSGTFVTPEELHAAQEKHDAYLAKWKRLRRVVVDAWPRSAGRSLVMTTSTSRTSRASLPMKRPAFWRAFPASLKAAPSSSSSAAAPWWRRRSSASEGPRAYALHNLDPELRVEHRAASATSRR